MNISVIIPAFNEESSIAKVINAIPKNLIDEIVVVNNNSTDRTAETAGREGAKVVNETVPGYGSACLKGIEYLKTKMPAIVVFIDGDFADDPSEMELILNPILNENYDFVLGSRILGNKEKGALPFQSRIGSIIAGNLIKLFWGRFYSDLGPFRAIKFDKLLELNMRDKNFGWTVEMQIKAVKNNLKIKEVPVSYRKRIGKSKITGTVKGTVMAGVIILKTIFSEKFKSKN